MTSTCTFGSCFDLTRCPLSSGFPVYFYNNIYGWTSTKDGYGYMTSSPEEACLYVISYLPGSKLEFQNLPYWHGDGRNHIIIDFSIQMNNNISHHKTSYFKREEIGKAMIVSSNFFDENGLPRIGFDLGVPVFKYLDNAPDLWSRLPSLMPVRRKYLMSYQEPAYLSENKLIKDMIEEPLNLINDDKTSDKVIIDFHCKDSNEEPTLCGTYESRQKVLLKSNFVLILTTSRLSTILQRITEALENGVVPVFICAPDCQNFKSFLPFEEVLDWSRLSIFLPVARITEIHFLLRSFPDTDLFKMKQQGRLIWQHYLGSGE